MGAGEGGKQGLHCWSCKDNRVVGRFGVDCRELIDWVRGDLGEERFESEDDRPNVLF